MCKWTRLLMCITLGLLVAGGVAYGYNPNTDPSLVAWWKLDDGSGTTAADSSGNGNTGTLMNGPVWVVGTLDGALQLDGTDDYVECGNGASINLTAQVTLSAWIRPTNATLGDHQIYIGKSDHSYALKENSGNYMEFNIYDDTWYTARGPVVDATFNDVWHHVAGTYDGVTLKIYVDGVFQPPIASEAHVGGIATTTISASIGRDNEGGGRRYYAGDIDDVRIYNRALTEDEILQVMEGVPLGPATGPMPKPTASDVVRTAELSWTPGPYAATHDVYFGTSFDDVNAADRDNPLDVLVSEGQTADTYMPAARLDFGQTYYWRVDEVNAAPDNMIFKGDVWSFTTETFAYLIRNITATASSSAEDVSPQNTVTGAGLDANDLQSVDESTMWRGAEDGPQPPWIEYAFDRLYKLHEMWVWNYNDAYETLLGFGFRQVMVEYSSDGDSWTTLGQFEFAQAPGADGYAHNTTIDFNGVGAQYVRLTADDTWGRSPQAGLSAARFYFIPVQARDPQPPSGTEDVSPDLFLSWRPGREAVQHELYVDTERDRVANGTSTKFILEQPIDAPSNLDLGATYYWRVDEVNAAETPSLWPGDVWEFTTSPFIPVDGFETYTDELGHAIFDTWVDGLDVPANGSVVGYDLPPYAEQTIVHSGNQSMPMTYDNTGTATESYATRTFEVPQDWSREDVRILQLYFYGVITNDANEPMWVRLTDQLDKSGQITYGTYSGEDIIALHQTTWHEWDITLADFGIDLTRVRSITIGFGGANSPRTAGTMYFDDIRLTTPVLRPGAPIPVVNFSFEQPGTTKQTGFADVPGWSTDTPPANSGVETDQTPADGLWTAYLMSGDPEVWQLTDHTIADGEVFELRVDARSTSAATTFRMTLYYDDNGTRVVGAGGDVDITGTMEDYLMTFSAADVPAAVGHKLGIEFLNSSAAGTWAGFDNVRLNFTDQRP